MSKTAVHFTSKEQDIIAVLKKHSGKVLSRNAIAKAIFGIEHAASNVVDAHIKNIRKKLDADTIESVRGQGYRFVGEE